MSLVGSGTASALQSGAQNSSNNLPNGAGNSAGSAPAGTYVALDDPRSLRLSASNIPTGASKAYQQFSGQVFNFNFVSQNGSPINTIEDWRVRISMQPAIAGMFYGPGNPVTSPLWGTNGVVFPYTPSVTVTHSAKYNSQMLTHSNYSSYFYEGSEVQYINIQGDFTVQNVNEGQYLMAAIQFFRACTKMFYGDSPLAGTPPPMVFLDGYGPAYLPHVPCVVTQFQHVMPSDVDYVEVPVGYPGPAGQQQGNLVNTNLFAIRTRLPTQSQITLQLQPVYSRNNVANNFTLEKYASGALIRGTAASGGGFI